MNAFPYAFIAAEHDKRHQRLVVVSATGTIERVIPTPDLPLDFQLLDEDQILLHTGHTAWIINKDGDDVWRYKTDAPHLFSAQRSPNGRVILGDTGQARIIEVDLSGHITRMMHFPVAPDCEPHYNMFRLTRPVANGEHLLVACHHDRKLAEFTWSGEIVWQAPVMGTPYEALRLDNGHTLASLGPSGLIVELDREGRMVWCHDMVTDGGLERGWIAGICPLPDGHLTYSDSRHDRLVEIDRETNHTLSVFHNPDVLLHPSTHWILP